MLRTMGCNVDSEFFHDGDRIGANGTWLGARTFHYEAVSRFMPQYAFGHLRPRRIAGAQDENSLPICHVAPPFLYAPRLHQAPV